MKYPTLIALMQVGHKWSTNWLNNKKNRSKVLYKNWPYFYIRLHSIKHSNFSNIIFKIIFLPIKHEKNYNYFLKFYHQFFIQEVGGQRHVVVKANWLLNFIIVQKVDRCFFNFYNMNSWKIVHFYSIYTTTGKICYAGIKAWANQLMAWFNTS